MTKRITEQAPDICVMVLREVDGQIYSEVIDKNKPSILYSGATVYKGIVIDRAKGRGVDGKTVQSRAKALADILGAPLVVDLTWPCAAARKLPCRCPKCVEEGRA